MSTDQSAPLLTSYDDVALHVVTGKGGTGKTTVAAALAVALARTGKKVLLCEVEGRQGIARAFDVEDLEPVETLLPSNDVHALALNPTAALAEYLAHHVRLGLAARALEKTGALEFATSVAPGVRDVLLTGKVYESVRRSSRSVSQLQFDAVVLDAPPTGRITQFLDVTHALSGLAKVGPVRTQADKVAALFRSPATVVHLTTLLEEMPTQETLDGIAELRAAGFRVGEVIATRVQADEFAHAGVSAAQVALVREGGLATAEAVTTLLADHAERLALQESQRAALAAAGHVPVEIPHLAAAHPLTLTHAVADALSAAESQEAAR